MTRKTRKNKKAGFGIVEALAVALASGVIAAGAITAVSEIKDKVTEYAQVESEHIKYINDIVKGVE